MLILTTTPWTLPANAAVCFGPEINYRFVEADGKFMLFANDMVETVAQAAGWENYRVVESDGEPVLMKGNQFDRHHLRLSDHRRQTLAASSGAITSRSMPAPALPTPLPATASRTTWWARSSASRPSCPVDDDGRFTDYVKEFAGLDTDEADPKTIEWLKERGTLVSHIDINHSYPHCWRCPTSPSSSARPTSGSSPWRRPVCASALSTRSATM